MLCFFYHHNEPQRKQDNMFSTSAIVEALQDSAAGLTEGTGNTWTGRTATITILAEDAGTENDLELLYFQVKDSDGAVYWVDEHGVDDMTDSEMQDRLGI